MTFKEWCILHSKEYLLEGWSDENLIPIDEVSNSSRELYKWICKNGHVVEQRIDCRKVNGCRYCSNKDVLKGYNDLETIYPEIAKQWNYKKNGDLKPDMFVYGSNKKVWWICGQGHEWKTAIRGRTIGRFNCPYCTTKGTSFPEQVLVYYLKKYYEINNRHKVLGKEIDISLKGYKIYIEYDGMYWHNDEKSKTRELSKNETLEELECKLFRIKESDKNLTIGDTIYYKYEKESYKNFEKAIVKLLKKISRLTEINFDIDVDINRDDIEIRQCFSNYKVKRSLAANHPDIAKEWNYEKNKNLKPENFSRGSNYNAWWTCPLGHEYQMSIHHRTSAQKIGCPICAGKRILKGFNDLESWCIKNNRQDIIDAWSNNNSIQIDSITPKSKKKVYWICSKNHEYTSSPERYIKGNRCPYCSGNKILIGFNDLKTWCIENNKEHLINEWDYDKNDIDITSVSKGSNKRVNWICKYGHSWIANINTRANQNSGCPVCYNLMRSGKFDL